ncbi:MAG: hypothetical protein OEV23_08825 [Gallionella sp.]|nr:hypothetical protein [Gallionella sp.]
MNKIQALVLVLAMSISGGVLAEGGISSGWSTGPAVAVGAPVAGIPGANPGFILFIGGAVATVAGAANVNSTPNH